MKIKYLINKIAILKNLFLLKQMWLEALLVQQSVCHWHLCTHTNDFPLREADCIRFLNQVKNSHLGRDFDDLENEIFRWPALNLKALACQPLSTWNGHHILSGKALPQQNNTEDPGISNNPWAGRYHGLDTTALLQQAAFKDSTLH